MSAKPFEPGLHLPGTTASVSLVRGTFGRFRAGTGSVSAIGETTGVPAFRGRDDGGDRGEELNFGRGLDERLSLAGRQKVVQVGGVERARDERRLRQQPP